MALKLDNRVYDRIDYDHDLNPRQQENYNFAKLSAVLASYGFAVMRLSDDWQGADCIAQHMDGETFIKIQLKSRLGFARKYGGKKLYLAFRCDDDWYLYPHDELLKLDAVARNHLSKRDAYSCRQPSKRALRLLEQYRISRIAD